MNPRQEIRLECGWCNAQKRWAENLGILKITSVVVWLWGWEFGVRPWCWEFGVRPCWWEFGVRPCWWEVGVRPWCWEFGVRPCWWEFGVRPWCWEIKIGPRDVPNVEGGVSIVWYERLLRIVSLSPRVEEPKSEINKRFVPEQQSVACVFEPVCVLWDLHMYTCGIQHQLLIDI